MIGRYGGGKSFPTKKKITTPGILRKLDTNIFAGHKHHTNSRQSELSDVERASRSSECVIKNTRRVCFFLCFLSLENNLIMTVQDISSIREKTERTKVWREHVWR